jgi:cell division protein FtsW
MGFVGVVAVVALFSVFCWLGFRIARTASDPFGQYLAVGLTATIGLTAFMHMAVSLGLMPTTGLTLPFMSYGRSSQVISLLGTGILINIGRLRGSPRVTGPRESRKGGKAARRNEASGRRERDEITGQSRTGRRGSGKR